MAGVRCMWHNLPTRLRAKLFETDCREAYEDHIAGLFLVDPSTPAFETMTELQDAKEEMISKWESKPLYRSNNKQNFEAAVASCCWQYLKDDRDVSSANCESCVNAYLSIGQHQEKKRGGSSRGQGQEGCSCFWQRATSH